MIQIEKIYWAEGDFYYKVIVNGDRCGIIEGGFYRSYQYPIDIENKEVTLSKGKDILIKLELLAKLLAPRATSITDLF